MAKTDMTEFEGFIKTLSDIELVFLQKETRDVGDKESLYCILTELGNREKKRKQYDKM